jgi:hypothetical protein
MERKEARANFSKCRILADLIDERSLIALSS